MKKIVLIILLICFQNLCFADEEVEKLRAEVKLLNQTVLKLITMLEGKESPEINEQLKQLKSKILESDISHPTLQKESADTGSDESSAGEELFTELNISGFFDVTVANKKIQPNVFELGDFELDLEKGFGENFQVGAALVFNDDGAELAVGFIDYHFYGGMVSARGRPLMEEGVHIQLGRFDVPFGNDWQFFASIDRPSVSAPLTTDIVMDGGYNDTGLRVLGARKSINYSFHVLRGIEEGISVGGRLGITPLNNPFSFSGNTGQSVEIGLSYLYDMDSDNGKEEYAYGIDLLSQLGPFEIQSEYLFHKNFVEFYEKSGYHVTIKSDLGEWFNIPVSLVSRYDDISVKQLDFNESISRLTLGLHMDIMDFSVLKFEYNNYLDETDDYYGSTFFGQMVITF